MLLADTGDVGDTRDFARAELDRDEWSAFQSATTFHRLYVGYRIPR